MVGEGRGQMVGEWVTNKSKISSLYIRTYILYIRKFSWLKNFVVFPIERDPQNYLSVKFNEQNGY